MGVRCEPGPEKLARAIKDKDIKRIKKILKKAGFAKKAGGKKVVWNDGYILECGDRLHTMIVMGEELLRDHPALKRAKLNKRFDNVLTELGALYQDVWKLDSEF